MWIQFDDDQLAALKRLANREANPADFTMIIDRIIHYESAACNDPEYRALAEDLHFISEGVCEIDDEAVVSASDDGAYVMAWVWVDKPECQSCAQTIETRVGPCDECGAIDDE